MKESDWVPNIAGNCPAYAPEFKEGDKWYRVPTQIVPPTRGVPAPLWNGGIINSIWLSGYAQAMALAWGYAAEHDARGKKIEVRVVEYELVYDIKARVKTTQVDGTNQDAVKQ